MDESQLLDEVTKAKAAFGGTCRKYSGALTVELIRRSLEEQGITVSPRDVFIAGIPIEIDLLIPKKGVRATYGLLYQPQDVLAALEVKAHGSFGEEALAKVRKDFQTMGGAAPNIPCLYVTLIERKDYKWVATPENIGCPVYTLFWYSGSGAKRRYNGAGDWMRFVGDLKSIQSGKT